MSIQAQQAREAFGARLRDLRNEGGLSGRELARLAGWAESKVSRFQRGQRMPTVEEVRTWCRLTGAEDQAADLIATLRGVEALWVEYKRMLRSGLKRGQEMWAGFEETAAQLRWYEQFVIPGLLQTAEYARAVLALALKDLRVPDDLDDAVRARMERQRILYSGDRRFWFLVEEQALVTRLGEAEVLAGQLDRLLAVMSLPRVRLGVIPADVVRPVVPDNPFVLFDDVAVRMETTTAELTVTQPREIAQYARIFRGLQDSAVYGAQARDVITGALA